MCVCIRGYIILFCGYTPVGQQKYFDYYNILLYIFHTKKVYFIQEGQLYEKASIMFFPRAWNVQKRPWPSANFVDFGGFFDAKAGANVCFNIAADERTRSTNRLAPAKTTIDTADKQLWALTKPRTSKQRQPYPEKLRRVPYGRMSDNRSATQPNPRDENCDGVRAWQENVATYLFVLIVVEK